MNTSTNELTETPTTEPRWQASTQPHIEMLSTRFRTPGSTQMLRPVQAASLIEAHLAQGLFGPQCMGSGVTLSSLLIPLVMVGSQHTVILVPAALRKKMLQEVELLRNYWVLPQALFVSIHSFESLAHGDPLVGYRPDLIVVPDCSKLKNTDTKTTKRVAEYMEQNPSTKFVAFTLDVYNFDDYQHIIQWCLKDKTPVRLEGESRADYRLRLLQTRGVVGHGAPFRRSSVAPA